MSLFIAVTDDNWFHFVRNQAAVDEINFWQPGGGGFRVLRPGELFLFKLHCPPGPIAGGGFFSRAMTLPYPMAWEAFGLKNGVASRDAMGKMIEKYRRTPVDQNYPIGCTVLDRPFFLDESERIPVPADFAPNIVSGKTYASDSVTAREIWERVSAHLANRRVDREAQILGESSLSFGAVITLGPRTTSGNLVEEVKTPWREIIRRLSIDPEFLHQVSWRTLEEIIAGAYKAQGCPEVILTPRSRDDGRDIIATWPGFGSIRITDQVKAYRKGHLVTPDEVRSVLGVLQCEPNVSKAIISTTSDFAPSIRENPKFRQFLPYRLELKNGRDLTEWLRASAEIP